MKKSRKVLLVYGVWMLVILTGVLPSCSAGRKIQQPATAAELSQSIRDDQWVFVADQMFPQYGRSRQITGVYEVNVHGDTADVYLPYVGRSYTPDIAGVRGPLDFSSYESALQKTEEKNDSWQVTLKPKDQKEVQTMTFTFYSNGTASLDVVMSNRSSISFRGTVQPRNVKKA